MKKKIIFLISLVLVLIIITSTLYHITKKTYQSNNQNSKEVELIPDNQNSSLNQNNEKNNSQENLNNKEENMNKDFTHKISIKIDNQTFTATLEDNETTKELLNLLPLDIDMSELNNNEKYYYLDSSLPNNPTKIQTINTGDIMLYGSNCLVLFYETFNTSYTYTRIGKLDNPEYLKNIISTSNIEVTITK